MTTPAGHRTHIDISLPIRNGMVHWPSDPPVSVRPFKSPEKGDRSRVSQIKIGSHTGTHVDAPRHYLEDGRTVDQLPLGHLMGPCCVVDCRGRRTVSRSDVESVTLRETPRVLFRTDNSERLATGKFFRDYVYLEEDAAAWLAACGALLVGVDGLSVDMYHGPTPGAHLALLGAGVTVIEGLNLVDVEPGRYELVCLPLRIEGCDGAPARAVLVTG